MFFNHSVRIDNFIQKNTNIYRFLAIIAKIKLAIAFCMSHLVFKLNSVPEDEADEVRDLLENANIPFYETNSGRWGLGFAAIWVKEKEFASAAKELVDNYQKERYQRIRAEHQEQEEAGEKISRLEYFMQSPIKFTILISFALALAYFTVIPFFSS